MDTGKKMNRLRLFKALFIVVLLSFLLGSCDAKFKEGDIEKLTPLHHAAFQGDVKLVKRLIGDGADINGQDRDGQTPLHIAVKRKHIEVVNYLINKKADMNIQNNQGLTPLSEARIRGYKEIEQLLLRRGAREKNME